MSSDRDGWTAYLDWQDELLGGKVLLRKRRRYCLLPGADDCLFEEQGGIL